MYIDKGFEYYDVIISNANTYVCTRGINKIYLFTSKTTYLSQRMTRRNVVERQ
jgi:hypothetical protein